MWLWQVVSQPKPKKPTCFLPGGALTWARSKESNPKWSTMSWHCEIGIAQGPQQGVELWCTKERLQKCSPVSTDAILQCMHPRHADRSAPSSQVVYVLDARVTIHLRECLNCCEWLQTNECWLVKFSNVYPYGSEMPWCFSLGSILTNVTTSYSGKEW